MAVIAPTMKAEQNCAVIVDKLTKIIVSRLRVYQAKERPIPIIATRYVVYSNDSPNLSLCTSRARLPPLYNRTSGYR